jgi:hypothetical protein
MIAKDRDPLPAPAPGLDSAPDAVPPGLPSASSRKRRTLATGEWLDLLVVPLEEPDPSRAPVDADEPGRIESIVRQWAAVGHSPPAPAVFVPLYGCQVTWTAKRAAVIGPPVHLTQLEAAVTEFAGVEADLRAAERRAAALLDALEGDVAGSLAFEEHTPDRRVEMAARHREAVAVACRLALLAPVVHAPPLHPPTLASQLGERLRERTRLLERQEFASQRADLAERVAEACGQRALEAGIARRHTALEWTIVVLLVVQTALLVVELLAQRATP